MKRALVTGASSGIGQALVPLLARDGYHLTLISRRANSQSLSKLEQNHFNERPTESNGIPQLKWLTVDLGDLSQVKSILAKEAPFDLLVNCAGYGVSGKFHEIPEEVYQHCWNVNFFAPVAIIKQLLPSMIASGTGTIVNVTSGVGTRALPYLSPYASAKAALNAFTDGLRVELRETNIHLLLFSPGPVNSGFQKAKKHYGKSQPDFPPFRGRSAEWVAAQLFKAIKTKKEKVQLGRKAKLVEHLNLWSPKLVDFILAKKFKIKKLPA